MKKRKTRDDFWFILALINLVAMAYPMSFYLRADCMEDQIMALFVLFGVGLILAIMDTVSIAVAYSQ